MNVMLKIDTIRYESIVDSAFQGKVKEYKKCTPTLSL